MKLGEMVISTAGRDAGRYFIVVSVIDDNYIEVADGDLRKIENPKLKNIKHIQTTAYVDEELFIWLNEGKRVRNEDLKSIINEYTNKEEAD